MADYYIGLSGLAAAQRAFDVIGNNIANAATEGYHRQKIQLSPAYAHNPGTTTFIGGVNIEGVSRMIDTLLEQEIIRQKSAVAAVAQETSTLGTIEAAFGEFSSEAGGLNATMDTFFNALQDLSNQPESDIWQNQLVSSAETLASQFRSLGQFLNTLQSQIKLEAEQSTETINSLVTQIAELNQQIERIQLIGGQTNSMSDHRDQCITKLADLIDIQTIYRNNGVIDVSSGGLSLVTGGFATAIEAGYDDNGLLGISITDSNNYTTNIQGGKMGGLLSLHNDILAGYIDNLDALATAFIDEMNTYHVMGIGAAGSFTQISGRSLSTDALSQIDGITNGSLYIRVTNTATGQVQRHAIPIDTTDTMSDVAAAISTVAGLTASVNSSNVLTISAGSNYTFDFMPAVLPDPTSETLTGASPPEVTVSGIYDGTAAETFTFTVIGDGQVGNGTLGLRVENASGQLMTLNIGSGYAAGDSLDLGNGIKVSLSTGDVVDGDVFTVDALDNTDTSGFLKAIGMNTFFAGDSAINMTVSSEIVRNPQRVATALGADGTDNTNILRMEAIRNKAVSGLNGLNCGEFYQRLVSDIGQEISVKQTRQESLESVVLNLTNRRTEVSGVDINREAAELLVFEQMFQAMAQYMNTINTSMASLMEIM